MAKLNCGIIGYGFIGKYHYEALRRLPSIHVRAVCVHDASKIESLMESLDVDYVTDDWRKLIEDPDIQVIHNCMPNHMHDELNLAAIKAGKHIYAEKPLSLTAKGAKECLDAAVEAGVAHGINHQYRMNAAVLEMKARLDAGKGGQPLYVSGQYMQESVARRTDYTKRRIPETSPARALLDIGVHWADTAAFVLGSPIKKVYAKMYTHYPVRTDPATGRKIEVHSDDTTCVMVEFENGTPGSAVFSKTMLGHKNDLVVTVSGEQAEYTWRQESCDHLYIGNRETGNEDVYVDAQFSDSAVTPYIAMPAGHVLGWQEAEKNAIQAFYASITDGSYKTEKLSYATFESGVHGNCFVEACLRSAAEDRWVELREVLE